MDLSKDWSLLKYSENDSTLSNVRLSHVILSTPTHDGMSFLSKFGTIQGVLHVFQFNLAPGSSDLSQAKKQGMTCDLFWLAALATPHLKSPPHPQPHATCFFDCRNSHPHPQLFEIDLFYYSIISCYQSQISLATYTQVHH